MRRLLLALAPALLVAAYLAAAVGATAWRAPSALEEALEDGGHDLRRGAATALPALAQDAADAVVLAAPGKLPASEQRALLRFAESGGLVVLAGPRPEAAPVLAGAVRTHPGIVYGPQGGPATLDGSNDRLPGARSLDLDGTAFQPVARTDARTFRDSDSDGALSLGEPAGPFIVAASATVGEGRVVLVGVESPDALAAAPTLLMDALGGDPLRVVLVEPQPAWATPAALLVHAAALSSASLLAAAALLLAAGSALAWLLSPRAEDADKARSLAERLLAHYRSTARPPAAPHDPVPTGEESA